MKRVILFLITNLAIMFMFMIAYSLICTFFGVDPAQFTYEGINYQALLIFALLFGMGGAIISLLLSKTIAKLSVGAKTIKGTEGPTEAWLVDTIGQLARTAKIKMPEVAIYEGDANAFATGAFRNSSLVAVSTGIIRQMSKEELRAVLGHEMSHIANGDMVTMTLLQGVLNACVIFLSRVCAFLVESALEKGKGGNRRRSSGFVYWIMIYLFQFVFGIMASLITFAYSRRREYAADAGSAKLIGSAMPMIAALRTLGGIKSGGLPDSLRAFGVSSGKRHASVFSTHPSIEDRIEALEKFQMRGLR